MERLSPFIDGQFIATSSAFPSDNPATGAPWIEIGQTTADDLDRAVTAAHRAFKTGLWANSLPHQRGQLLRSLADITLAHADELGRIETADNGKLLTEMTLQCRYLAQWLLYFAGLADKVEGRVLPVDKANTLTYTLREPLGVIACIVPWNSPLLLTMWKLAPALAAGCTVVVKPSEFTSASLLRLMALWQQALPPGVVNVVTGLGPDIGQRLVAHPLVRGIAFTGGERAGVAIAQTAAERIVPVTLELGGKSANIVFPDADTDNAVKGACAGIFAASGQTCIAGSRLLLHDSIADEFLDRFLVLARTARIGDPMLAGTQVGPITTQTQYNRILSYIDDASKDGADLVLGGRPAEVEGLEGGWFVQPTVFSGVTPDMALAREEVFGPVLSVIRFSDEEEALAIANGPDYGLAAGLWTNDLRRAHRMARGLEAGSVWVNTYRTSAPQAPFGGYKRSGLGREGGQAAMEHFLETKAVWIDMNDTFPDPFVMRL
jgi:aldehyde dehydrogenase (NAD+)